MYGTVFCMATAQRRRDPPPRPRAERREQLLDAALRLIDAEGFASASVEGVAREAGLAQTVVYDTLGTRGGLLAPLRARGRRRARASLGAAMPEPPLADDPQRILTESLGLLLA